jgi:hypothetical protein
MVSVQIVRFVDDWQPGWVEARLLDASGREWVFVDKVPIFSAETLDAESDYPRPGSISCEVLASRRDGLGREVCTIDTARPDGVEAEGGETKFDVLAEQLSYTER